MKYENLFVLLLCCWVARQVNNLDAPGQIFLKVDNVK